MQRERIIHLRADAVVFETGLQLVPLWTANDELVVNMLRLVWHRGGGFYRSSFQQRAVHLRVPAPRLGPGIEPPQLHAQHRRLQRVQTRINTDALVEILSAA